MVEDKIPSKEFIARAVKFGNRWHGQFSAPGLIPDLHRDGSGEPYIFDSEEKAEVGAMYALYAVLNVPRDRLKRRTVRSGKPQRLSNREFADELNKSELAPSLFAHIYGTTQNRVMQWIDGVEDVPHPARVLLAIFQRFPDSVDVAEDVTDGAIP